MFKLAGQGSGRLQIPDSIRSLNWFHLALRKFHLLEFFVGTGLMGSSEWSKEGRCWDQGKESRTVRCSEGPAKFTKARSELEVVPHLPERKVSGCLWSKSRVISVLDAQFSSVMPSGLVK